MPQPSALDESWASLDTSEYSHDDDLHSEATDVGSLIELSSAHDTESAVEDETQSEAERDEDQATSMIVAGTSVRVGQGQLQEQEKQQDEDIDETIIMHRSEVQDDPNAIKLEYSRQRGSATTYETISMTISKSCVYESTRPFKVAYFGSYSSPNIKDELLGKIGAALVSTPIRGNPTVSPCFNVVPTEFGPGSKPAFADLIPSQGQISIDDITVLKPTPASASSIKFALNQNVVLDSRMKDPKSTTTKEPWYPDILVLYITREDAAEDFFTVNEVLELARRHHWPTITVAEDTVSGLCPQLQGQGVIQSNPVDDRDCRQLAKQPVEISTFVSIDTDQLNRHIRYITDVAQNERNQSNSRVDPMSSLTKLYCGFFHPTTGPDDPCRKYALTLVEPQNKEVSHEPLRSAPGWISSGWYKDLQQTWATLDGKQFVKDMFIVLLVMFIGTYIVSSLQDMAQKPGSEKAVDLSNGAQQGSKTAIGTGTVTATLADPPTSTTCTSVLSVDRDIVVYDPISFDQVWNRLTGRPKQDQGLPAADKAQEAATAEAPDMQVDRWNGALLKAEASLQKLLPNFGVRSLQSLGEMMKDKHQRNQLRRQGQRDIKMIQAKVQEAWTEFAESVGGLRKQSQESWKALVDCSQNHLQTARRSSRHKLERLVAKQKRLLDKAQIQIHGIVHPQRKKHKGWKP